MLSPLESVVATVVAAPNVYPASVVKVTPLAHVAWLVAKEFVKPLPFSVAIFQAAR